MIIGFSRAVAPPTARSATRRRLLADLGAPVVLALFALAPSACNETADGALTLVIDTTAPALDPLADPRVTRLALYDDPSGDSLGEAPLNLGGRTRLTAVAPGTRHLRLEALSATNQVLAAAHAFDVQLTTGHWNEVTMHLRKPLAYVGGGSEVQVNDTAASGLENGTFDPVPLAGVRALATTRSGDLLLAAVEEASSWSFVWIGTNDHAERGRVPLGAPVRSIVVHPRDRTVLLLQTLADTMLVVDVEPLRTGGNVESAIRPVSVQMPLAAVFDQDDSLWVLATTPANCDRPLSNPGLLMHVDIDGNQIEPAVGLPSMANDVGINPVSGRPMIALVCAGLVSELREGGFYEIAGARGVGDVVVAGDTLYAVGWQTPTSTQVLPAVIVIRDLGPEGTSRQVVFPIESLVDTLGETDAHGNLKYYYIAAKSLEARAVTVTSHGRRVAFLHTIKYELVTDTFDPFTGRGCIEYAISLTEEGVTLVDLEAGQIVSTRATDYDPRCVCDRVDQSTCLPNIVGSLEGPRFTPSALTVLTGGK